MSQTVRQDIVDSAVRFLVDPKVQTASLAKQISFLETKGLSSVEIDEALKRSKVITPSANDSSAIGSDGSIVNVNAGNDGTLSQQENGGALVGVGGSGGQQQQQAHYHNQYGSTMPVGVKPIAPPRPQYSWKDYFIAAVMAGGLGRRVKQEEREELIRENNRLTGQLIERIEKLEHKIEDVQSNTKGQMDEIKQELIGQVANKATEGEKDREMYEKERQEFERMLEKSIPDLIEGKMKEHSGKTNNKISDLQSEIRSLKVLMLSKRVPPSSTQQSPSPSPSPMAMPMPIPSQVLQPTITPVGSSGTVAGPELVPSNGKERERVEEESKQEEIKQEEIKQEEIKQEEIKQEESKQEEKENEGTSSGIPAWQLNN